MPNDQLFLLRADFADPALGPGAYHCTDCARIEGLLSYFPALRTQLDVTYVDLPRPRAGIVALLGEASPEVRDRRAKTLVADDIAGLRGAARSAVARELGIGA